MSRQPIGVFDSGMGGLTALRKLAELLPHEDLVYLGDTARVPYGNRSPETIIEYAKQCTEFLLQHSVKKILVACNSVSAVALPAIEAISPVPVIGVITPAVAAVARAGCHRVGIIGTRATVNSGAYVAVLEQHCPAVTVHSQACPLFVPLIEEGWHSHVVATVVAQQYLRPLQQARVDALILACTHYPVLAPVIQRILPQALLIDSGVEAAIVTAADLVGDREAGGNNVARTIECYVTDATPAFGNLAQQFLGMAPEKLQMVRL